MFSLTLIICLVMAVRFVLQKCNNQKSDNYGQYVARVRTLGTISTAELSEQVQQNASVKRSDVKAVIEEFVDVLKEKLGEGFSVKIDGIGTFSPRIRAKYQTVTAESPYDIDKVDSKGNRAGIVSVGVLFRPERKRTSGGTIQTLMPERKLRKWENYVQQTTPSGNGGGGD